MFHMIQKFLKTLRVKQIMSVALFVFGVSIIRTCLATFSLRFERNTACHYTPANGTFPLLEKNSYLPTKSIFFHETSCPGNLTLRQYCAIESAAKQHLDWQINVIFSGPVSPTDIKIDKFSEMTNIKFWKVNILELAEDSPMEGIINSNFLKRCRWGIQRTKDVLKYLSLYTWGGMYLDLDFVVARYLGSLSRNWATRDDDDMISEGILAFSNDNIGRNIAENAIREMQATLKTGICSSSRPAIMTRVLGSLCTTPDTEYMSSATCNGFEVYGPQFFHPIPEDRAVEYFMPGELQIHNAYTYHMWGHKTKQYVATKNSPYAKLAKKYCPITFKMYTY